MTQDEIKTFTLRVTEANSCDLIVILYDVILSDTKAARVAKQNKDRQEFAKVLSHATKTLAELIANLNFEIPLSKNLYTLYSYCSRRLSYAAAGYNIDALDIIDEVINKLRQSFEKISTEDTSGPCMKNTQSVYAGLTYGKGTLNETFVNASDYNRGFSA